MTEDGFKAKVAALAATVERWHKDPQVKEALHRGPHQSCSAERQVTDALISRRIVPAGDNAVSVIELWDTGHPSSPFTVIKFNEEATMPNHYERVFILSNEEFRETGIKPHPNC